MRRTFVHGVVLASVGFGLALFSMRCAEVNRGLGAPCIRDEDCLSGLCEGLQCVAQPTLIDGGGPFDAGVDAPVADAGVDAPPKDAGAPPKDSGHPTPDTGVDAGHDAADGASVDAATDVGSDVGSDAPKADAADDADAKADGHAGDGALKDGTPG